MDKSNDVDNNILQYGNFVKKINNSKNENDKKIEDLEPAKQENASQSLRTAKSTPTAQPVHKPSPISPRPVQATPSPRPDTPSQPKRPFQATQASKPVQPAPAPRLDFIPPLVNAAEEQAPVHELPNKDKKKSKVKHPIGVKLIIIISLLVLFSLPCLTKLVKIIQHKIYRAKKINM